MSKKHFIELADMIREFNERADESGIVGNTPFTVQQISALADFCRSQNYNFKGERWVQYIAGKCGPSGGAIKLAKAA